MVLSQSSLKPSAKCWVCRNTHSFPNLLLIFDVQLRSSQLSPQQLPHTSSTSLSHLRSSPCPPHLFAKYCPPLNARKRTRTRTSSSNSYRPTSCTSSNTHTVYTAVLHHLSSAYTNVSYAQSTVLCLVASSPTVGRPDNISRIQRF